MYCSGLAYTYMCMKSCKRPSTHVSRRHIAAEWPPWGLDSKAMGSSSRAACPQVVPMVLHLSSPCVSPQACGSARQQGRTLDTTEDPSLHAFSRNSSGGLPFQARQKSSAAPATARVAWWPVRGSKAKIQPLQLLWLNHLLNYTGKCAWNHNLHWFSSPLPETRVNWDRGNHSS